MCNGLKIYGNLCWSILTGVVVMACQTEDIQTAPELATSEAETSLADLSFDLQVDVVEMLNTGGAKAASQLVNLVTSDDVFTLGNISEDRLAESRLHAGLTQFRKVFIPNESMNFEVSDSGCFDFVKNFGKYEWDSGKSVFVKSDSGIQHIEIHFPTAGASDNNATFRLLNYQESTLNQDGLSQCYPTLLVADLVVDGVLVSTLNIETNAGTNGLEHVNIALFVSPFDYRVEFKQSEEKSELTASINRETKEIFHSKLSGVLGNGNQPISGRIDVLLTYHAYEISGYINGAVLEGGGNSENISLVLLDNDSKVGDIVFEPNASSSEDLSAHVILHDGTKKPLDVVLEPMLDELEKFVLEIEGEV